MGRVRRRTVGCAALLKMIVPKDLYCFDKELYEHKEKSFNDIVSAETMGFEQRHYDAKSTNRKCSVCAYILGRFSLITSDCDSKAFVKMISEIRLRLLRGRVMIKGVVFHDMFHRCDVKDVSGILGQNVNVILRQVTCNNKITEMYSELERVNGAAIYIEESVAHECKRFVFENVFVDKNIKHMRKYFDLRLNLTRHGVDKAAFKNIVIEFLEQTTLSNRLALYVLPIIMNVLENINYKYYRDLIKVSFCSENCFKKYLKNDFVKIVYIKLISKIMDEKYIDDEWIQELIEETVKMDVLSTYISEGNVVRTISDTMIDKSNMLKYIRRLSAYGLD